MRVWYYAVAGLFGWLGGFIASILANGDQGNLLISVSTGFFVAVGSVLVAWVLDSFSRLSSPWRERERARRIRVRKESAGSFSDRLKLYASNTDASENEKLLPVEEPKSKMDFWVSSDLNVFERTPPKPIGIIRALLIRIRRILNSG